MSLPSLQDQFAALIATPSVSCTQPHWDQSNRAVIDLLAGEWRLARSTIAVTRGAAARDKVVKLAGEPGELAGRIGQWLKEQADNHG